MSVEVQSAALRLPRCGADALGIGAVHRYAVAGASNVQLPAAYRGKFVRVNAIGCDLQIGISYGAAGALTADIASPVGAPVATAGGTIANGSFLDGIVEDVAPTQDSSGAPFLNWVPRSGGTGFIEFYLSEAVRV